MDESTPAPGAPLFEPRPVSCPPWCTESRHDDLDPPGTALHRSPPTTVAVYDEACALVAAHIRAAFWDKEPDWIGTDPADLERPHVEFTIDDDGGVQLYLTPGQARSFAAALVRAAAADTEAFYRTPQSSGAASQTAPASAPPLPA
ncbi:DUF6907 domain-containing protein [Actinoplanes sp. NPDC049118]|uniref:DUF6907 domain-containing protein n=1 Tax=Actinoplanes sp. NPDC049118 TaxID=3155769 RepID=UPI0033CE8330